MSGVAAIWTRSDAPASTATLEAMTREMDTRGPDGCASWYGGPVAIAFLSFASTPEALAAQQPSVDAARGNVVSFDGRLDNREELRESLDGEVSTTDDDARYVAAAYRRWGTDAIRRLIGDFALVLWDERERRLICARDVMGVRPLCYATGSDGRLLVASELRALLASGEVDAAVNEARALEHLVDRQLHRSETLYRAVHRVPPAHVLIATRRDLRLSQYWDFDASRQVRYGDDRQYAEHARDLIATAIRRQSRAAGRVGILLSGGLDSSSVTALAAHQGIECEAMTVGFDGGEGDEQAYAQAVAHTAGVPLATVSYRPAAHAAYLEHARVYRDLPDYPNGTMLDPARELAASRGIRVLLTGVGGDEWFTGSPYRYADWIRDGAVIRAAACSFADGWRRGWRQVAREALLCGVWPALPPRLRAGVKRVYAPNPPVPPWIDASAAERVGLAARVALPVRPRDGESFAQADTRTVATCGFQVHSEEMEDRAATRAGVEQRNPFYDRRIIEFAFALPEDQRWRGRFRKRILRNAVAGLLPPAVGRRHDKAEFSGTYADALARWPDSGWPRLVSRGWVDRDAVALMGQNLQTWRKARDPRYWSMLGPFWMLHALEAFLAARSAADDAGWLHQGEPDVTGVRRSTHALGRGAARRSA
jgi:asparagine synthase (glutamine-hydrolysing)